MKTIAVPIGSRLVIGGDAPIIPQTMCNTHTRDVEATVAQCVRLAEAGAGLIRITVPGLQDVQHLGEIKRRLRSMGIETPLVADIHFSSETAIACAAIVEKVRINPGNFNRDHAEACRQFSRFLDVCKEHGTAVRIGLNHGSLGERITQLYGNTSFAMAKAAMEWLEMCIAQDFYRVVVSLKASNTVVMVDAYRQLARMMEERGVVFPMHVGVTEAGGGDSGRIKSCVGISALLSEGLGNTVRVSLTEDPAAELPVARYLCERYSLPAASAPGAEGSGELRSFHSLRPLPQSASSFSQSKDLQASLPSSSFDNNLHLAGPSPYPCPGVDTPPDPSAPLRSSDLRAREAAVEEGVVAKPVATLGHVRGSTATESTVGAGANAEAVLQRQPSATKAARGEYAAASREELLCAVACDWGKKLLDREIDEVSIGGTFVAEDGTVTPITPEFGAYLSDELLQACRRRFYRPEYIACPGCGRTMYNLQETFEQVRRRTGHLKDIVIAVMGCIVNGPGEMADADYGYVGEGGGRVTLYRGKEPVLRHIPDTEAVDRLLELIENDKKTKI